MLYIIFLIILVILISIFGGIDIVKDCLRGTEDACEKYRPKFECHYSTIISDKSEKYVDRPKFTRINIRQGQLKLFLTELEFYMRRGGEVETVIYVGAAPGHHQKLLVKLFPRWHFVFYDPREFEKELIQAPNVDLRQEFFSDEEAEKVRKEFGVKKVLFLSDIRTGEREEHEREVQVNMAQQLKWCQIIKPKRAFLKFRLPFAEKRPVNYFTGDIYLQPFCGPESSEGRLDTDCDKIRIWNNDTYNGQFHYWQVNQRPAFHKFEPVELPGIDHCWDCWALHQIAAKAIPKLHPGPLQKFISEILENCFSQLSQPPHGLYPCETDIWMKMKKMVDITLKAQDYINARRGATKTATSTISLTKQKREFKLISRDLITFYEKLIAIPLIFDENKNFPLKKIIKEASRHKLVVESCSKCEPQYSQYLDLTKNLKIKKLEPYEFISLESPSAKIANVVLALICERLSVNSVVIFVDQYSNQLIEIIKLFPLKKFYIHTSAGYPEDVKNLENLSIINDQLTDEELRIKYYQCILAVFGENGKSIIEAIQPVYFMCTMPVDLDGKLRIPPWNDRENGLMLESAEIIDRKWDHQKIAESLFHFNICVRPQYHNHVVSGEGIDHCWDCWCESEIWKRYFVKTKRAGTPKEISEKMTPKCCQPHGMLDDEKNIAKKIRQLAPYTIHRETLLREARDFISKWNSVM